MDSERESGKDYTEECKDTVSRPLRQPMDCKSMSVRCLVVIGL